MNDTEKEHAHIMFNLQYMFLKPYLRVFILLFFRLPQ